MSYGLNKDLARRNIYNKSINEAKRFTTVRMLYLNDPENLWKDEEVGDKDW